MSFGADLVPLVPAGTVITLLGSGQAFDLSGYSAGVICINVTAAGTTWTPVIQWSDDSVNYDAIPSSIIAAPGAITAISRNYYQFLPANLALTRRVRIQWAAPTGSFTFGANAYMRRG
jgi:hypothetical protein